MWDENNDSNHNIKIIMIIKIEIIVITMMIVIRIIITMKTIK
jgi:hypothetical protein